MTEHEAMTPAAIADLRAVLDGAVITPDDATYDDARAVWNGVIDRRPGAIARCSGVADVVATVGVAHRHRVEVAIRGGGHQTAGSGVCDDGLVIDLSQMNGVHVDPDAQIARVQAGARWRDVDRATQRFGLATTGGEVSTTGVAGLTLGGGMGLLQRSFGLACDNLRSIEIVTADGEVRTADATQHPELLWAARGGGRGLGVVTSFEFALRALGPEVAVGWTLFDLADATSVARRPGNRMLIAIRTLGGAVDRTTTAESAYPHRGRRFNLSIDAMWSDPADDDRTIGWARGMWTAMRPYATWGVYVNFSGFNDEPDVTLRDTLGNQARLTEIRTTYDPDGLFAAASQRR